MLKKIPFFCLLSIAFSQATLVEEYWCPVGHFNEEQQQFVTELVRNIEPEFALEIGFCTGRSALSVLMGHTPDYFLSVDIDLDYRKPHGRRYAFRLMRDFSCFHVIEANSKKLLTERFLKGRFPNGIDYALIDGDHSYEGCTADLEHVRTALNEWGVVLIDDYMSGKPNGQSIPKVTKAVDAFCERHPEYYKSRWHVEGKGIAILTRSLETHQLVERLLP